MVSPALEGLFRSLRVYHGDKAHHVAMDRLYGRFLKPGQLAFDIGAHVGDRISSFRRLGARVVALEPQPLAVRALRLIHGRDPNVTLLPAACAKEMGRLRLRINSRNPTVSTGSEAFVAAAAGAGGWEGQTWDTEMDVPAVTLDLLVAAHGAPDFVKIDVEGCEDAVLGGLSRPLPALSFEFTTIQRDVAFRCLDRLAALGPYRFDVALGESQSLTFNRWIARQDMVSHIRDLAHEANSGDIYAVLAD